MKKLLAIFVCAVMLLCMSTAAFAAVGDADEPETITIGGMPAMAFLEAEIAAGAEHHYTYTAEAGGLLSMNVFAEGAWSFTMQNGSATVSHSSADADTQGDIAVASGDVVSIVVKNDGDAAATISCNVSFASAGTVDNPEVISDLGNIDIELDPIDHYEHYYSWTATESGTLSISVNATTAWTYIVGEDWYNDTDEEVITHVDVEVAAGDVIVLALVNADWDNNNTFHVEMSFSSGSSDSDPVTPDPVDPEPGDDDNNSETGDAIGLVAAMLTVSTFGLALLKKKN